MKKKIGIISIIFYKSFGAFKESECIVFFYFWKKNANVEFMHTRVSSAKYAHKEERESFEFFFLVWTSRKKSSLFLAAAPIFFIFAIEFCQENNIHEVIFDKLRCGRQIKFVYIFYF